MTDTHVLEMPKGFLGVRIAQLVFGLVELGLIAYLMSNTIGGVFSAEAWTILVCIATLIIVIYNIVAQQTAKSFYNMWAILSLDVALVIFWLSAMGSLASLRSIFVIPIITNFKRSLIKRILYAWATNTYLVVLSVTAALAAIELILFIASLVMVSIRIHQHRAKNAPAAAVTLEKMEAGQAQQPQQQQQQPQGPYPQNGQQQQFQQQPQYQQQAAPQQQEFQQQPQFQQQQQFQQVPPQQQFQQAPPQQQFQQAPPQQQVYNQAPPQAGFTPVSPMQQPYQPAMSPPPQQYPTPTQSPAPQYVAPQPQYPVQPLPHGVAEAPAAEYRGAA